MEAQQQSVEYIFDGVRFLTGMPEQTLQKIRDGDSAIPNIDVLIATYPRCGTARLLEIVWLLMHDADTDVAGKVELRKRYAFLEFYNTDFRKNVHSDSQCSLPLLAKTHIPYHLAAKTVDKSQKIIVGMRNPKDCLLSYYHFYTMNKLFGPYTGSWDDFFELVKSDELVYNDFFDWQLGWWQLRDDPNIMFVEYEGLSDNPTDVISKIAKFVLNEDIDEAKLRKIVDWTSFSSMKSKPTTNYSLADNLLQEISPYMRVGKAGQWREHYTEEQNQYIDQKCKEMCEPDGLKFKWD